MEVRRIKIKEINSVIQDFEESIEKPNLSNKKLYTGIDIGTAFIVLCVFDEDENPVCGAYEFAQVVRDGMIVDYVGACDIVKKLKKEIEDKIGQELLYAGCAIPPGTENLDGGVVKNVAESSGFIVEEVYDEPTAANTLLKLDNGAVIDIGGGTTGISVIKNNKVVEVFDEPSGGTHFSLVLSGAYKIDFDSAEELKRDFNKHNEIFPVVRPVIDKIISIIENSIKNQDIDQMVLVGGTALLTGIEEYIEEKTKIKTIKPKNPMFVTPIGIALSLIEDNHARN